MHKIPLIIVDDFFENPGAIRDYALSLEYSNPDGNYPGTRSELLNSLNPKLFQEINLKLFSLLFDFTIHNAGGFVESSFQLVPCDCEEGWVHVDLSTNDWSVAGVVYLNNDAPLTGGTSIYRLKNELTPPLSSNIKAKFYSNEDLDLTEYRTQRDQFNANYEKTIEVGNIFNRLVMYNTNQLHRGDIFFGNTKTTSRLTLVFFAKIFTTDTVKSPIARMRDNLITEIHHGTT